MATVSSGSSGTSTATNMIVGFGLAIIGLVLSFVSEGTGHAKFYSDPSVSFGGKVDQAFDGAEPPSEGFGL
jgi:hypothetical protein